MPGMIVDFERPLNKIIKHIHNMNRNFRHKILAGVMLFGFMLAGTSCQDTEEGIRVTDETPFADKTLYEVIKNDSDLANFVKVLDACGAHCADSLFNQSRVYTLWAPVISEAEADKLIADMGDAEKKEKRDIVFRSFIEAHIANHIVAANGTLDSDNLVLLLNGKNAVFTGNYRDGYTFAGVELTDKNIRVKNGVLHKLASPSEYKYSIWEFMKIAKGDNWSISSVSDFLYSHNVTEFNEGQSISGPIVNGEQTFIDSVFTTSNVWLDAWRGVGNINNEDSTYIVYVPNDEMWAKMVVKAEAHYNYDMTFSAMTESKKAERDSLRRHYARFNNLKYMTYSVNEQKHVSSSDSMMPAYRGGKRVQFAKADLDKNVIFEEQLSNGIFKVVDAMPYKQTDLWHDTIFLEGENESMWDLGAEVPAEVEKMTAYKSQINKDSMLLGAEVSGGSYFSYTRSTAANTAKFKIPKVLSAKYQVAIIFVPQNITNELVDKEKMYPTKMTIKITQAKGQGSAEKLYEAPRSKALFTDPFKMDTLFLTTNGEKAIIKPTYCEFYDGSAAKDYNVTLEITSILPTNKEKENGIFYDPVIRIDKIMLIPVLDSEE